MTHLLDELLNREHTQRLEKQAAQERKAQAALQALRQLQQKIQNSASDKSASADKTTR